MVIVLSEKLLCFRPVISHLEKYVAYIRLWYDITGQTTVKIDLQAGFKDKLLISEKLYDTVWPAVQ